jgi:xylulokinase
VSVLLGFDVGTGGARAVAVDESGGIVTEASSEYPLLSPRSGGHLRYAHLPYHCR